MIEPRGIRINNPCNIRRVEGQTWVGQAIDQPDPGFVAFVAPQYGYRAADHIIMRHYLAGKTTVADVISHWAPPSENDTKAYLKAVETRLNIVPGSTLSLPAQMPQLLHAMTVQEQGQCPYSDEVIMAGINLDGQKTVPPITPVTQAPPTMKTIAIGAVKSKTMNFAGILLLLSNLQPLWPQIGAAINCSPAAIQLGGSIIAIIVAYLRFVTNQSLADKGSPPLSQNGETK